MAANGILVPLSDTVTVRQTVGYAVQSALEDADELDCHLVVALPQEGDSPTGETELEEAERLLERAESWANEDAGSDDVTVETSVLGADEYLFGPREYAEAFAAYADEHGLETIVLDPEYRPGVTAPMLQPLERELSNVGLEYDEAPVERPAEHERLVGQESFDRMFALFWISYGFYLVLGDPTYWFDLLTGAAVAAIVSVTLSSVTFTVAPDRIQSPLRTVRFVLYVPYLAYEIVKANLAISAVILRPSMPIEPTLTRLDARVGGGLPLLALANSITLTPGTLTVRANDQRLLVHTLIPSAREDLFDGGLERAVRFVFYGRDSASIPTPEERDDAEIVGGDEL
ncbi:monovalent cation/H+ antiporter subunit E [Halostagnicola kamekurae]|uniref:Multisubunit sodium/proton antiporter, MrpE subunit n=1 Tax=Halostagnicola kamekurae TaxID=619731 RepID=A0A1I6U497_9EURY|nr:monovalent cation/H+ antiporter subunit E [Halostagnicola kamekurae]SFS96087.1 multisubunit sodium/proton antiporter, MrpE subunit [Halostagnicola kamekurae]